MKKKAVLPSSASIIGTQATQASSASAKALFSLLSAKNSAVPDPSCTVLCSLSTLNDVGQGARFGTLGPKLVTIPKIDRCYATYPYSRCE